MAAVRLEALRALADVIEERVPGLRGRVTRWAPNRTPSFPALELVPIRFRYFPDQASEAYDPGPGSVVMNVGRHELEIQLKLQAQTPEQRAPFEEELLDLFLGTQGHPGALLVPVEVEGLGPFTVAWELEEEEWSDEAAWNVRFWSSLIVTGEVPALVTRGSTYTLTDLRLAVAGGDVRIRADGTVTR